MRMVLDLKQADPADHSVITRVARQLGVGAESLRTWVKQSEVDAGARGGLSTEERAELVELRKKTRELQRSNDMAGSGGGCNELCELLRWCHESECLAWPPVEAPLNAA